MGCFIDSKSLRYVFFFITFDRRRRNRLSRTERMKISKIANDQLDAKYIIRK